MPRPPRRLLRRAEGRAEAYQPEYEADCAAECWPAGRPNSAAISAGTRVRYASTCTVITQNQTANEALCRNSQGPLPGPATASMIPEPKTPAVEARTTGPSIRSTSSGGPFRRYGALPV
jgi:hypothetical protein